MSRNKENLPIPSNQRSNGVSFPSSKQLPSDEFFTDSLLDATRLSQIPTPSPQKPSMSRPRRARTTKAARNALNPSFRPSVPENGVSRPRIKSLQPATPLRNGTGTSRIRTHSLNTPPESKSELPLESPYSSISSPPPQDLAAAYRQIEDEEDLAQTERELSSDESNGSGLDEVSPVHVNKRSYSESPYKVPPTFTNHSANSTPTRSLASLRRERFADRTDALSEASGLSFLKEMTDQRLAEKLTPHVSESARDKARLKAAWDVKPVAFSRADPVPRFIAGTENLKSSPKIVAFSKASKPLPNGILSDRVHDYFAEKPPSQQSGPESIRSSGDTRPTYNIPAKYLQPNNIDRQFKFSTNHGFPITRPALTEKNLEQQNRGGPILTPSVLSQNSAPSLLSDLSSNNARVLPSGARAANTPISRLPQFRKPIKTGENGVPEDSSQVDWAAAAADVPIPSVETSLISENKDVTPMSNSRMYIPEKNRLWLNDFTGHSFQVSESPPVRQQPIIEVQKQKKEIEAIAQHAVATNRLSEIRERQSLESLRSISKSPALKTTSQSSSQQEIPLENVEDESELAQPVPDTPVVIYRSTSNGSSDKTSGQALMERPEMDRRKSDNQLQRLARAMSSTPRSSPASGSGSKDLEAKTASSADVKEESTKPLPERLQEIKNLKASGPAIPVAQTPRVVGAWTDTILPDTVKTVKQIDKNSSYAQTPHVSAGGWIDTPIPNEQRKYFGLIPTIVEEVPEELTNGIVKDNSSDTVRITSSEDNKAAISSKVEQQASDQPKSALASILDKQQSRLVSQDITNPSREDTLNLGNDTIESLKDLLALDEDEVTTLSRLEDDTRPLDENVPDAEVLERLSFKLNRLQNNIHTTRKGISKLEHQVSAPSNQLTTAITPQALLIETVCPICKQQTFQPHNHPDPNSRFPHIHLTFTLPIPLLFKPRTRNQWLPRPTLLGTAVLSIWTWYLLECIMCELYSRPTHTDFYVWPSEPEPEFPYVLPTMLGRWTRLNKSLAIGPLFSWLWGTIARLVTAIWRIFGMALGWSDGFANTDDASVSGVHAMSSSSSGSSRIVRKIVQTTATALGMDNGPGAAFDLSMNDDEYI